LLAAGFSVLAALALVVLAIVGGNGAPAVMTATVIVSLVALGCGLGLPLAVAGWHSLQRRASPRLRMPPIWLLLLLFVACLGLGTLALRGGMVAVLFVPPLHVVASTLPALILAAAVLPSLQAGGAGLTRRNFVAMLAFGGLAATSVAIVLESLAALTAMSLAAGFIAVLPGGDEAMRQLSLELQSPAMLSDPERLLSVFISPALVAGIGLLVAIVVPLIEETVKSLGAWMEGSTLGRLNRSQAFAFGVIAGIGFSLAEALFYGTMGLPYAWASSVLVRSATAVIHATATGLVALGWYEVWIGRPRRFALYAGAGIGLHAVWNGLAGLSAVAGQRLFCDGPMAEAMDTALASVGTSLLVVTLMGAIALLAGLTIRLRREGSSSA
jgi:hypothetical protein